MDNTVMDKQKSPDLKERFLATMILHATGDTIGFKNGEWEMKLGKKVVTLEATLEMVYDFVFLGGINRINLEGWMVSDDTLFNMGMAFALLESKNDTENILEKIKLKFQGVYGHIILEERRKVYRYIGYVTQLYINKFTKTKDARHMSYDPKSGGNGAAMRTHCIGLAFHGEKNRERLIEIAIESSRMTHNSPIGYLGGLVSALFTAYAIEDVPITEWPEKMLKIVESDNLRKYIRDEYREEEESDYTEFIRFWKKYIELRFVDGIPIITKSQRNLIFRSRFYMENFTRDTKGFMMGDSGYSSVIMAYDCLLDSGDNWEKLIMYGALHWGDSDTVAAIACGWYGAMYGFGDVPNNNHKYLEYKEEINKLGENLYKRFVLNEEIKLSRFKL